MPSSGSGEERTWWTPVAWRYRARRGPCFIEWQYTEDAEMIDRLRGSVDDDGGRLVNERIRTWVDEPLFTESALRAEREAREKAEEELDELKLSGPPPTRDELDIAAENVRLRDLYENVTQNRTRFGWTINHLLECEEALRCSEERAEKAEEALRQIRGAHALALTPKGRADRMETIAREALPVQKEEDCTCDRDTLMDGMATPGCPVHAAPQPEEETQTDV